MSVSAEENTSSKSTEFNQSGSDFMCFNQKHNKTNCREHLETQDDDDFESTCNRISTENSTIVKYRMIDAVHSVVDSN